jgi:hypothetical protein
MIVEYNFADEDIVEMFKKAFPEALKMFKHPKINIRSYGYIQKIIVEEDEELGQSVAEIRAADGRGVGPNVRIGVENEI